MSNVLKINNQKKSISILDINSPECCIFKYNKETTIKCAEGDIIPSCINCTNPKCQYLSKENIFCPSFKNISQDINLNVCPVNAIKAGNESIEIDENICIGCGICAARCPIGAIHIKDGKAKLNTGNKSVIKKMTVNNDNINIQNEFIDKMSLIDKNGCIREVNELELSNMYNDIVNLDAAKQNKLARNLLIMTLGKSNLSRQGDVYARMDGFYETGSKCGVIEVETGMEMLDVSRALLDDIAVLHSRHGVSKEINHPLAICLNLPNRRVDFWQVIKDIAKITNVRINTITYGILFIFLWNLKKIKDIDLFYVDIDNSSLRKQVEAYFEKKIDISQGYLGILENSK